MSTRTNVVRATTAGSTGKPPQTLTYNTRVGARNEQIINSLMATDPTDIVAIATAEIKLLNSFYSAALDQAQSSFRWALAAAGIGLIFFTGAVGFLLITNNQNLTYASLIAGALVEVISGINFYLYGRTMQQLDYFNGQLDRTQRYLLANSIGNSLTGNARQQAIANLVALIAGAEVTAIPPVDTSVPTPYPTPTPTPIPTYPPDIPPPATPPEIPPGVPGAVPQTGQPQAQGTQQTDTFSPQDLSGQDMPQSMQPQVPPAEQVPDQPGQQAQQPQQTGQQTQPKTTQQTPLSMQPQVPPTGAAANDGSGDSSQAPTSPGEDSSQDSGG